LAVQTIAYHVSYLLSGTLFTPDSLQSEEEQAAKLKLVESFLPDASEFLELMSTFLVQLNPDERRRIRRLIGNRIKALSEGKQPTDTLPKLLDQLSRVNVDTLSTIPSSIGKAKGSIAAHLDFLELDSTDYYDAMCLLPEYVSDADRAFVVSSWKEELRDALAEQSEPLRVHNTDTRESAGYDYLPNPFPVSHIFWSSRDFQATKDAVSRYLFMETFNIGEFPQTASEIEGMFAREFVVQHDIFGRYNWIPVAFDLWLASRSPKLCARIRPFLEIALTAVANQQTDEGWWYVPDAYRIYPNRSAPTEPDNYPTALACTVLLRLSRSDWQLHRAREGARWLARQQSHGGGWFDRFRNVEERVEQEPNLFTTLLAAEAIRSAGLEGYGSTLSMADSWILNQQEPDGTWKYRAFSWPFTTVLTIEHFERKRPSRTELEGYLSVSKDFIMRSEELALEDNENARRLAIVTAFQGMEAFLYACLSKPSINKPIFRNRHETIGYRQALNRLEEHLRSADLLEQGESITRRNSLDALAQLRDEVVHKAASVSESEARKLTRDAAYFGDSLCQQIFGFALL